MWAASYKSLSETITAENLAFSVGDLGKAVEHMHEGFIQRFSVDAQVFDVSRGVN